MVLRFGLYLQPYTFIFLISKNIFNYSLATIHSVGMIPSCTCNFTLCCPVGLSWLMVMITLKQSDVFRFLRLDDDGNLRIYNSGRGSRIKIARWSQFLSACCAATRRLSDAALVCCCQTCATRLLIGFEKARDFWGSWLCNC